MECDWAARGMSSDVEEINSYCWNMSPSSLCKFVQISTKVRVLQVSRFHPLGTMNVCTLALPSLRSLSLTQAAIFHTVSFPIKEKHLFCKKKPKFPVTFLSDLITSYHCICFNKTVLAAADDNNSSVVTLRFFLRRMCFCCFSDLEVWRITG